MKLSNFACTVACLLVLWFGLASCNRAPQRYAITGQIISIDRTKEQIILNHGDIPGYMPAMVMPFKVKDASQLTSLAKGDQISATLAVSARESWLENIKLTRKGSNASDERDTEIRSLPHEGDEVPAFTLINQDGKRISLGDYRGKALAITFVYTRCPLPDYCPLMSSNFAEIEKSLRNQPDLLSKTHLLTVSFDPKHDSPAVLRSYGAAYTGKFSEEKFDHWEFAGGSDDEIKAITKFFGLQYSQNSDQIVHSLVTAVLTPDGKIYKIYSSNDWKPAEVINDFRQLTQ